MRRFDSSRGHRCSSCAARSPGCGAQARATTGRYQPRHGSAASLDRRGAGARPRRLRLLSLPRRARERHQRWRPFPGGLALPRADRRRRAHHRGAGGARARRSTCVGGDGGGARLQRVRRALLPRRRAVRLPLARRPRLDRVLSADVRRDRAAGAAPGTVVRRNALARRAHGGRDRGGARLGRARRGRPPGPSRARAARSRRTSPTRSATSCCSRPSSASSRSPAGSSTVAG